MDKFVSERTGEQYDTIRGATLALCHINSCDNSCPLHYIIAISPYTCPTWAEHNMTDAMTKMGIRHLK